MEKKTCQDISDGVPAVDMKARSSFKTISWSETEWEEGTLLEKGEGIISTAGSSFHPTNHTNMWHSFSSETLAGLCFARQFSMC